MVETIMVVHGRSVGGKEKRRRRLKSCSKRKCRQSRQIVCIFWSVSSITIVVIHF
ncbi:hypothetical protein HanRHA438_Chr01g0034511 [Helianthus annuus]|nr:hypothetical protein HanRHA438_Chr01g0034511 [Helianthus annuus]